MGSGRRISNTSEAILKLSEEDNLKPREIARILSVKPDTVHDALTYHRNKEYKKRLRMKKDSL